LSSAFSLHQHISLDPIYLIFVFKRPNYRHLPLLINKLTGSSLSSYLSPTFFFQSFRLKPNIHSSFPCLRHLCEPGVQHHWLRQLWGTGTRAPLDVQLFNFSGLQSRTKSDIRLHVVTYPVKITLLVSCPPLHQILATPAVQHVYYICSVLSLSSWTMCLLPVLITFC